MSLNSIIESDKLTLCECTDPNKTLLNKLYLYQIITDGMRTNLVNSKKKYVYALKKIILKF
jgi:hypothetical protein